MYPKPNLRVDKNNAKLFYSAVQINMLKGYVSTVLVHATFCPVYLDSRVFAKSAMKLLQ